MRYQKKIKKKSKKNPAALYIIYKLMPKILNRPSSQHSRPPAAVETITTSDPKHVRLSVRPFVPPFISWELPRASCRAAQYF